MANILIHIGYAKAGSTYLQQWFHSHPGMYFQPVQHANGFFNAWEMARFAQNAGQAPENFVLSCEGISLWEGNAHILGYRGTVPYNYRNYQDVICEMLYRLYPTAKTLIVTRGYTTIFKSIYAEYISKSGTFTFREILAENPGMLDTLLDYSFVIELYRKKFGPDNVIVLPYELLRDDASAFLSIIEQQLNITDKFEFNPGIVNAAPDDKMLYVIRRVSLLVYGLLKPLPPHLGTKLYSRYMKLVVDRRLLNLFNGLSKINNKKISLDGIDEMVASMKGKAGIFRNEPLYQPYLKEYLL